MSPVHRRSPPEEKEIDTTQKASNRNFQYSSDDECTELGEDFECIYRNFDGEDDDSAINSDEYNTNCSEFSGISFAMTPLPPPPLRHINEHDTLPYGNPMMRHDYDRTRKPQRSALRKPNSKSRNVNSIDNSKHSKKKASRGITRNHSDDGTDYARRGSGSLHAIRMRGSLIPIHRRQSIGFAETVRVQEVTPTVELNDGNTRDLWLQADEAIEIKERRRMLLKKYKEKQAAKHRRDAERRQRDQDEHRKKELEKVQRQQKIKHPKNSLSAFLSPSNQHKKESGFSNYPETSLPVVSPSGRRWVASGSSDHPSLMELSAPSRGVDDRSLIGLPYTSSFTTVSSGGSSISGHDDSFRGLEKYIDRSGKHQKNMVWDAVFIEQDEQLQFGYYDDERIANLYRSVQNQHDGQQKAVGRAKKDRKAADNYLMTPRTLKLLKKTINVNSKNTIRLPTSPLFLETEEGKIKTPETESIAKEFWKCDRNKMKQKINKTNGNLGKHGKSDYPTCESDSNDDDDNKPLLGKTTTALKGSGSVNLHNKFLRRLSV